MGYKVFLVEDEIITREGIRDNVDWGATGFEFCGEAPDGEIALPLIEETKPDVLITDIKMPFMDGLQLSKIVREHMPWIKVIILSGHDEFHYAQSAVKLGVTEYLLKPVSAQDLSKVLKELSATLERENQEREKIRGLQNKVEDNLIMAREKFILKLVMGGISSGEAIDQSQQLGLDIVAKFYLVTLIRIDLCKDAQPFDYAEYQKVDALISEFSGDNPGVLWTKKDLEEHVLLLKGGSFEQLAQEGKFLGDLIKTEVENRTTCSIVVEIGSPQGRLGDIHHSFAEALVKSRTTSQPLQEPTDQTPPVGLVKADQTAVENYLKFGSLDSFNEFFSTTLQPISAIALRSPYIKHYIFVDIILTASQFISNLGIDVDELTADVHEIEALIANLDSMEQIKDEMKGIFSTALRLRNSRANHERLHILQRAKEYTDQHFTEPELKMSRVAEIYSISPSHFSTIFHQEFGVTFRSYLGSLRITRAQELLGATNLRVSEVAYQSGFNDSHYFSSVFKKKNGLTPQQFRARAQKQE